jgi:hypothetical protein
VIIECTGNKLLGAEGLASEDEFIKVLMRSLEKDWKGVISV